jgi:hypothetical protein
MNPTARELELGARAYEQVRFYENVTRKSNERWIYLMMVVLVAGCLFLSNHRTTADSLFVVMIIPAFYILRNIQLRMAKLRQAEQKLLLQLLEEKYGDALPWVVEQKQLALARELETRIAQAREPTQAGSTF